MRLLAERILATEILSDGTRQLSTTQRQVVEKLVHDCNEVPGIRRLGRNPLLLTLLVLIYANSGPMVAKRHIVYAQAIRTLVLVRQREVEREVLSEADLRRELGIVALAIYNGEIQEIPTRSELHNLLLENTNSDFFNHKDGGDAIDDFLLKVSNSTGIIRFHERANERADDVMTFMHHSFLEFYAAIRLIDGQLLQKLTEIARDNRWREVVVLASGIYADRGEVTDIVRHLKSLSQPTDGITGKLLNLSIDCAFEADVPPVAAQELLGEWIVQYLEFGSARFVFSAREELAKTLSKLVETTRSIALSRALALGILSETPGVSAASIELAGLLGANAGKLREVIEAFDRVMSSNIPIVKAAIVRAVSRSAALRNPESMELFRNALDRGSVIERSGPQILDSRLSEILVPVQAARSSAAGSKYTTSGVRRSSARCRRLAL